MRRFWPLLIALSSVCVVAAAALQRAPQASPDIDPSASPDQLPVLVGTVTRVKDGDTIVVELESGPINVRLGSIDAPEKDQPWGVEATTALRSRVQAREVALEVVEQDRYERLVAVVYLGDENLNACGWRGRATPGRTVLTWRIPSTAVLKTRHGHRDSGCGRCRRQNGARRGNGDSIRKVTVHPSRTLVPRPAEIASLLAADASQHQRDRCP